MKVWILAGLLTIAMAPIAAAAEDAAECQLDESRRAAQVRADIDAPPAIANGARTTVARREAGEAVLRQPAERRRNGKRIPDAQLIGPRGAL